MGRMSGRWGLGLAGGAALGALLLATSGCATTGGTNDDSGDRSELTREAIMEVGVYNLYDVVQRLRPEWLTVTGGESGRRSPSLGGESWSPERKIVVVRNGSRIGDAEMLRQLAPENVQRMRYVDGEMAASTLVGTRGGTVEGAIVIETMR